MTSSPKPTERSLSLAARIIRDLRSEGDHDEQMDALAIAARVFCDPVLRVRFGFASRRSVR